MWLRDSEERNTELLDAQLFAQFGANPRQEIYKHLCRFFENADAQTASRIEDERSGKSHIPYETSARICSGYRRDAFENSVAFFASVPSEAMPRLAALMFYSSRLGMRYENRQADRLRTAFIAESELAKIKQAGKKGAAVRHKENHAMKAQVFDWLDSNFDNCKSMDSAAELMAGKLVPATFRTVRGWVTEWKKLRSASTP